MLPYCGGRVEMKVVFLIMAPYYTTWKPLANSELMCVCVMYTYVCVCMYVREETGRDETSNSKYLASSKFSCVVYCMCACGAMK